MAVHTFTYDPKKGKVVKSKKPKGIDGQVFAGDTLQTGSPSKAYKDNWDRIFGKKRAR